MPADTHDRASRFSLIPASHQEAVVIDHASGAFFGLNASATEIWRLWLEGASEEQIADWLAQKWHLDAAEAFVDVQRSLRTSEAPVASPSPPSPYTLEDASREIVVREHGRALFRVALDSQVIALAAPQDATSVARHLWALSPNLLALLGITSIHASCVAIGDAAVAFLGRSGAGKTTTARAFVAAGARLICEDKLLLAPTAGGIRARPGWETTLARWTAEAGRTLAAGRGVSLPSLALPPDANGEPMLAKVFLLEADNRVAQAAEFAERPLIGSAAVGALLNHAHRGSANDDDVRRLAAVCRVLGEQVAVATLLPPEGLEAVRHAAARYITKIASKRDSSTGS